MYKRQAALWLAKPGYCDYLIPQLYWGLNYRKNGSDALSLGRLAAEWLLSLIHICTGYTDQKVRWLETEPRGGKRCREAVPDRKQLAGEVSTCLLYTSRCV